MLGAAFKPESVVNNAIDKYDIPNCGDQTVFVQGRQRTVPQVRLSQSHVLHKSSFPALGA